MHPRSSPLEVIDGVHTLIGESVDALRLISNLIALERIWRENSEFSTSPLKRRILVKYIFHNLVYYISFAGLPNLIHVNMHAQDTFSIHPAASRDSRRLLRVYNTL